MREPGFLEFSKSVPSQSLSKASRQSLGCSTSIAREVAALAKYMSYFLPRSAEFIRTQACPASATNINFAHGALDPSPSSACGGLLSRAFHWAQFFRRATRAIVGRERVVDHVSWTAETHSQFITSSIRIVLGGICARAADERAAAAYNAGAVCYLRAGLPL